MTITKKPTLFIGGVQKSGTTSLHYFLSKHPEIFIPQVPEELHFFDLDENYSKGLDWYMSCFSEWRGEAIIAQTSPLYIYQPDVPARIKEFNPDAKFIFILRNPIDRAYSHYWNSVRFGYENLSFEQALDQEKERIIQNSNFRRTYSYFDRGIYTEQLLRYYELFPRENILILLFEQLKKSYVDIGNLCGDFLDIDPSQFVYSEEKSVRNQAKLPRFRFLQRWISQEYERLSIEGELNTPLAVRIIGKINLKNAKYPPMKEATKLKLLSDYKNEIISLQDLLNINLQHWLN